MMFQSSGSLPGSGPEGWMRVPWGNNWPHTYSWGRPVPVSTHTSDHLLWPPLYVSMEISCSLRTAPLFRPLSLKPPFMFPWKSTAHWGLPLFNFLWNPPYTFPWKSTAHWGLPLFKLSLKPPFTFPWKSTAHWGLPLFKLSLKPPFMLPCKSTARGRPPHFRPLSLKSPFMFPYKSAAH